MRLNFKHNLTATSLLNNKAGRFTISFKEKIFFRKIITSETKNDNFDLTYLHL